MSWEPIEGLDDADQAVVEVPLDYETDGGETTVIEVFRLRSPGSEASPLVLLQGGPGGDVAELSAFFWPGEPLEDLRMDHDIYLVNTRGLGEGGQTPCAGLEPGWHTGDSAAEDLEGCLEQEAPFLRSISTANSARDLDYLRELLGIERWTVYGVSYGSMLAAAYAADHPDRLDAVVLDGVLPPSREPFAEAAEFILKSLALLRVDCAAQQDCPQEFSEAPRELIEALLARAEEGWTVVIEDFFGDTIEVEITPDRLLEVIAGHVSDTHGRFELPAMLVEAADGDASALAEAIEHSAQPGLDVIVHLVIACRELWREDLELDPPPIDQLTARIADASRRDYDEMCPAVVSALGERAVSEPNSTNVPALLLSGEVDARTPPEYGHAVADGFVDSTHAVLPRHGHGVADGPCGASLMLQFVRDPASPIDDGCVADATPPWPEGDEDDIDFGDL